MSHTKHTPGPISAEKQDGDTYFLKDNNGKTIVEISAVNKYSKKHLNANAHVFAAAPGLLEVTKRLMNHLDNANVTGTQVEKDLQMAYAIVQYATRQGV